MIAASSNAFRLRSSTFGSKVNLAAPRHRTIKIDVGPAQRHQQLAARARVASATR
jgi:hypothetical protein